MKNRLIGIALFVAATIFQCFILNNAEIEETEFGFVTTYMTGISDASIIQRTFFSYLPIPFLLFIAEDVVEELVKGYSLMVIVRNYSRKLLFVKMIAKVIVIIALSVIFITLVSTLFGKNNISFDIKEKGNAVTFYGLVLLNIAAIDILLALILHKKQASNIFINAFFVLSLLLPIKNGNSLLNCIFFPRLAFPRVNGVMGGVDIPSYYLQIFLVLCFVVICIIGQARYKNMDVY